MAEGYYNIVLVPDMQTAKIATDFAHSVYSPIADEYCLTEGKVFPHITLTQFKTADQSVVDQLVAKVNAQPAVPIEDIGFSEMYARPVEAGSIPRVWIGLNIKPNAQLSDIQGHAHEWLTDMKLQPLNGSLSEYWPHMTLARIKGEQELPAVQVPDYFTNEKCGKWTLKIGRSDANGQFLG